MEILRWINEFPHREIEHFKQSKNGFKALSVARCIIFITLIALGVFSLGLFAVLGADSTPEEGNAFVMGVILTIASALLQTIPFRYLSNSILLILFFYIASVLIPLGVIIVSTLLLGIEIGFDDNSKALINHAISLIPFFLLAIPPIITFTTYLLLKSTTANNG